MRKLNRLVWEAVKDELVDEALQAQMVATFQRSKVAALAWLPRTRQSSYRLPTPYGVLDVWAYFRGCWKVKRDYHPLIRGDGPHPALFTSVAGAKAAGLIHLREGFGNQALLNDTLRWSTSMSTAKRVDFEKGSFAVDLPDDHEWGRKQLDRLLCRSEIAAAADENLLIDISCVAQWRRLPPPPWTSVAQGLYRLDTPYGLLSVRRMIGWTVERNGMPLLWFCTDRRVIYDKLEDARTSALVHMADEGTNIRYADGTRWGEAADRNAPAAAVQMLSAA
jgi:hypothetical protein